MIDHFHAQVIAGYKIGGQARTMAVCSGIERAIQYYLHLLIEKASLNQSSPSPVNMNMAGRRLLSRR